MSLRFALLALAAFVSLSAPAYAVDWGDDVEVMADYEMADLRGGLAIGGLNIDFGAVVTTFVNNMPVLSTQISLSDTGAIVEETVGDIGRNIEDMTPEARDALGLGGLDNAHGVVIDDADGVTALVHNITESALQNIIINNAAGRDLRQEIDVTVTLPGFEAMQNALLLQRLGMRLDDDMRGIGGGAD